MSELQDRARLRANVLRQLKAGNLATAAARAMFNNALTEEESKAFMDICYKLNEIADNWHYNSRKLGFNAKHRCGICKKVAKYRCITYYNDIRYYCEKHKPEEIDNDKFIITITELTKDEQSI